MADARNYEMEVMVTLSMLLKLCVAIVIRKRATFVNCYSVEHKITKWLLRYINMWLSV
jgi:hypothetical protein